MKTLLLIAAIMLCMCMGCTKKKVGQVISKENTVFMNGEHVYFLEVYIGEGKKPLDMSVDVNTYNEVEEGDVLEDLTIIHSKH